jgi:hypothetical protein
MKGYANIQLLGDYGSKSGVARLMLPQMTVEDYTTMQTKAQAFAAAIKTAKLTGCVIGDITTSQKTEDYESARPGASINVRRKLVFTWRKENDSSVRRGSISGVPADAPIDQTADGAVLNATGKTALQTALNALYSLTPETDGAIVLQGAVDEDNG